MGTMLIGMITMLMVIGLVFVGTRVSLYLFLLNTERTRHFTHRMHATEERSQLHSEHHVERPIYYGFMNTGDASARYARGSLMVIALILLLAIMAAVSVLSGSFH
ncbi:MAG TPA: hypothetical protein VNE38_00770 [Ktedonobacteraceae bacterium]|nr:hypothetical protein [Ktedonobacteraceae bacterium]